MKAWHVLQRPGDRLLQYRGLLFDHPAVERLQFLIASGFHRRLLLRQFLAVALHRCRSLLLHATGFALLAAAYSGWA